MLSAENLKFTSTVISSASAVKHFSDVDPSAPSGLPDSCETTLPLSLYLCPISSPFILTVSVISTVSASGSMNFDPSSLFFATDSISGILSSTMSPRSSTHSSESILNFIGAMLLYFPLFASQRSSVNVYSPYGSDPLVLSGFPSPNQISSAELEYSPLASVVISADWVPSEFSTRNLTFAIAVPSSATTFLNLKSPLTTWFPTTSS